MRGDLAVAIDIDADVDAAEIGRIEPDVEAGLAAGAAAAISTASPLNGTALRLPPLRSVRRGRQRSRPLSELVGWNVVGIGDLRRRWRAMSMRIAGGLRGRGHDERPSPLPRVGTCGSAVPASAMRRVRLCRGRSCGLMALRRVSRRSVAAVWAGVRRSPVPSLAAWVFELRLGRGLRARVLRANRRRRLMAAAIATSWYRSHGLLLRHRPRRSGVPAVVTASAMVAAPERDLCARVGRCRGIGSVLPSLLRSRDGAGGRGRRRRSLRRRAPPRRSQPLRSDRGSAPRVRRIGPGDRRGNLRGGGGIVSGREAVGCRRRRPLWSGRMHRRGRSFGGFGSDARLVLGLSIAVSRRRPCRRWRGSGAALVSSVGAASLAESDCPAGRRVGHCSAGTGREPIARAPAEAADALVRGRGVSCAVAPGCAIAWDVAVHQRAESCRIPGGRTGRAFAARSGMTCCRDI